MSGEERLGGWREGFRRVAGFDPGGGDLLACLFLFISLLVFFAPVIFSGQVFFFRDLCLEIAPKRWLWAHSGSQVLWNPYCFFGLPEGANMQSAVFYPLNFIFFLGDVPSALSYYIILHFAIGLAGSFVLARSLRAPAPAALAGALAFTYGGFFVSLGNQVVVLSSAAWIMWLLWAAGRAWAEGLGRFIAVAGIFWALQVLGGEPEIAYLSGLLLLVFFAARIFSGGTIPGTGALEEGASAGSRKDGLKRAALIMAGALLFGLGLSAVQWVITLEFTPLSNRAAALPFADAVKWSLPPRALISLLIPNFIQDPSSKYWVLGFWNTQLPYLLSIYPGVAVLLFIGLALARKNRGGLVLAAGALFFLILSLGKFGGLYYLCYEVLPGFDRFRIPERCLYGFSVLAALLAASGVTLFLEARAEKAGSEKETVPVLVRFAPVLLGAAGLLAFLFSLRPAAAPSGPGDYFSYQLLLGRASALRSVFMGCLGLAILAAGLLQPRKRIYLAWAACALIFLDLDSAHRRVNPTAPPDFYAEKNEPAPQLARGQGRTLVRLPPSKLDRYLGVGRSVTEFYRNQRQWLQPFSGLPFRLHDVFAHSSFYPADVDRWARWLESGDQKHRDRVLYLSGVSWVFTPGQAAAQLPDFLPRALVVPEAQWLKSRDAAIAALDAPDLDPRQKVLLEGAPPANPPPASSTIFGDAHVLLEDNQRVVVSFSPDHPGWLVLLDSFYPGWKAYVNEKEVPIYRANGFFRAVPVGSEGGRAVFKYEPPWYRIGFLISLVSLVLGGVMLGRAWPSLFWWLGWIVILALLPLEQGGTTYLPVTALRVLALAMAAAGAFRIAQRPGAAFFRTGLDYWVLGFWVLAAIAMARSSYFYISLYWHLNLLTLILLFYVAVQFTADEKAGRARGHGIMTVLVAGYLVQAVWAILQWRMAGVRASGGFFNPSFLAGALMAVSGYVLARGLSSFRERGLAPALRAGGWCLVLAIYFLAALASGSRAVVVWPLPLVLVALPGLSEVMVARGRSAESARRRSRMAVGGIFLALVLALVVVPNPLRERMKHLDRDAYAFARTRIWRAGLSVAAAHPLGVGPGMFKYYSYQHNFPMTEVMAGQYERHPETAHNEYLHLAAELSPLAVICLLVPWFLLVRGAVRTGWTGPGSSLRRGLAAGLVSIALHSLFDSNLHDISISVLAAVTAGILVAELGRGRPGWTLRMEPGRLARRWLGLVFLVLLLLGGPGYLFLGWSYGLTLKAGEEPDPSAGLLRGEEALKYSFGNQLPYKLMAARLTAQARGANDREALYAAIKAAETAVKLNPADPRAFSLLGRGLLDNYTVAPTEAILGRAERALKSAVTLDPFDVDAYLALALIARRRGDRTAEIAFLTKVIALEPYDLAARVQLIQALLESGATTEARAAWEEFLKRRAEVTAEAKRWSGAFAADYKQRRITVNEEEVRALEKKLPPTGPGPGPAPP